MHSTSIAHRNKNHLRRTSDHIVFIYFPNPYDTWFLWLDDKKNESISIWGILMLATLSQLLWKIIQLAHKKSANLFVFHFHFQHWLFLRFTVHNSKSIVKILCARINTWSLRSIECFENLINHIYINVHLSRFTFQFVNIFSFRDISSQKTFQPGRVRVVHMVLNHYSGCKIPMQIYFNSFYCIFWRVYIHSS